MKYLNTHYEHPKSPMHACWIALLQMTRWCWVQLAEKSKRTQEILRDRGNKTPEAVIPQLRSKLEGESIPRPPLVCPFLSLLHSPIHPFSLSVERTEERKNQRHQELLPILHSLGSDHIINLPKELPSSFVV
jgi:hypothetical protein